MNTAGALSFSTESIVCERSILKHEMMLEHMLLKYHKETGMVELHAAPVGARRAHRQTVIEGAS
jgi:hypothetical protein